MISIQKMVRFALLSAALMSAGSCVMEKPNDGDNEDFRRPGAPIDLPEIIEKGKLTVLAENASATYFIYKGKKWASNMNCFHFLPKKSE